MSDNDIFWATFRNHTQREMYVEIENLGRNRWACVVGDDEFTIRTKEKDFLTVLRLVLDEAAARRDQTTTD